MPTNPTPRGRSKWSSAVAAIVVAGVLAAVSVVAQAQFALGDGATWGGDRGQWRTGADGNRIYELIGNFFFRDPDVDATGAIGRLFDDPKLLEIVRGVIVRSDSLDLWTDSLRVYRETKRAFAYGSVRIETVDGAIAVGRDARYDRTSEILTLIGKARVIDGANVIEGDSIQIDRTAATVESWGAVRIVDEENRSVIDGRHAFFDDRRGLAVVDSLPFLRSRRGDNPMTLVESDWLAFDDSLDVSTAIGDVDFTQGDTKAHADTARFHGEDLLVLTGAPTVEQEARVMNGDEIRFVYEDGDLQRIHVFGQASLVDSSPDSLQRRFRGMPFSNTLSGDSLTVYVRDGEIVRTSVKGNAASVYIPEDQETTVSVNDVKGDAIDIFFVDGKVDAVQVRGRVTGIYRYLDKRQIDDLRDARRAAADSLGADVDEQIEDLDDAGDLLDEDLVEALQDSLVATAEADTVMDAGGRIDFDALADVVEYEGKSTEFAVRRGRIHIADTARVKNGTLELFAEDVYFDVDARELLAEGDPRLIDEGSELVGERMGYLFDPQTGAVADGATRFDDGFYTISHARRIDKETLLAEDAIYTVCELEEPHYHFHAKRMKLKIGQTVVARQVTFYVSDIPIMTLPFFYKDLKKGRRSGITFPQIDVGVNSRQGRYIRDLGFYWATNDYTDFLFQMDFNERRNFGLLVHNRYRTRYDYNGQVKLEYKDTFAQDGGTGTREWRLSGNHTQNTFLDVWSLNTTYDFASRSLTGGLTNSHATTVKPSELRSTARMARSFDNGMSLSLNASRNQFPNREDGDVTSNQELSRSSVGVSLGVPARTLMGGRPNSQSPWWNNVLRSVNWTQSYSANLRSNDRENSFDDEVEATANMGLDYAPPTDAFIQPRFTIRGSESWRYRKAETKAYDAVSVIGPDGETQTIGIADPDRSTTEDKATTQPSLSFSTQAQSTLYGIFPTPLGPLRAMRHKAQFSVTHSYRPDLGDKQEESQDVSVSWNNDLSMKVRDGDELDEDGNEKTRNLDRLLTWNLSSRYDPDARPGTRWSDITSSVSLRPPTRQPLNFSMSQTIDPYSFEVESTRISADLGLKLRSDFDLGGVLRVRGERQNRLLERLPEAAVDSAAVDSLRAEEEAEDLFDPDRAERREEENWLDNGDGNRMPWTMNVKLTLNRSSTRDGATTLTARVPFGATLALPGAWKAAYSANFDVDAGVFTTQEWTLNRDLHHWRLEFIRRSSGTGANVETEYGFRLYLQPIQDLSVDKGPLARGGGFGNRLNNF